MYFVESRGYCRKFLRWRTRDIGGVTISKTKYKILLTSLFLAIGLTIGFFYVGFMDLALKHEFKNVSQLTISKIFASMLESKNHLQLFLGTELIIVCLIIIFVLLYKRETYESEKDYITKTIEPPKKIAQNQHGSAKWIPKELLDKTFASAYIINGFERKEISKGGLVVGYGKIGSKEKFNYLDDDVHTCVIGATRSGKTRSILLQSICLKAISGESMILSDPKSEIFEYTVPFLERLGYEVITIDFKIQLN